MVYFSEKTQGGKIKQPGLFDMENRLESLSKFGDPLEKLKEVVNFEVFRAEIEEGLVC